MKHLNYQHLGDFLFSVFLEQLKAENRVTQSHRFAKGTAQNMISAIKTWLTVCVFFNFRPVPATSESVIPFLELMALTVTYGHLKHLLTSIKFYHQTQGYEYPDSDFDIVNTLHGLKRKLFHTPRQALPINPVIMRAMYRHLDMNKVKDLALWSSFLLSFYCLFRKSNTVPKSASKVNMQRTLLRRHIRIDDSSNTIYVHVTFSKTIQFGEKDIVIPIPSNSDPAMDPVRHLRALFRVVKCSEDSPAFSFSEHSFISYSYFTTQLKKLLSLAGYDPSLYSGHSFRRGGATYLFRLGASILQIQSSGDWASQCFVKYLYITENERLIIQRLMSSAISSEQF